MGTVHTAGKRLKISILRIFAALVASLSPRQLDGFARLLTVIAYSLCGVRRRLILQNVRLALGGDERRVRRVARAAFHSTVLTFLEFLHASRHDLVANVTVKGREHVEGALAKGQGCFFLCCHIGNWEAMGAAVNQLAVPTAIIVKKVGSEEINEFVESVRARNRFMTIKRGRQGDAYRAIKQAIGRGEGVGFVMDQARPGSPRLPFFGVPASTNTSLAAIWQRLPAPVVPVTIRRLAPCRHELEFLPALDLPTTADKEADILAHATRFNQVIEQLVLGNPEQYFWLHNRWKP